MSYSLLSWQATPTTEQVSLPLTSLLEQGLRCAQQQHFTEAVTNFALARERLAPNQDSLAVMLDTLIQCHAVYWQAQQDLFRASKLLVEADLKQQEKLAVLEEHLLTLVTPLESQYSTPDHSPIPLRSYQAAPSVDSETVSFGLYCICFGRFEVRRGGQPIELCPNRKGQAILRYLLTRPERRETLDKLMATLCPEDEPEVARHKIAVAISALRCTLNKGYEFEPGGGYILYKHGVYQLNPDIPINSDVEEFQALYQTGRQIPADVAVASYERACLLYTGPFLAEDTYADWSFMQREQFSQMYLDMCSTLAEHYLAVGRYEQAIERAAAILKENRCDEGAHRQLIRAYAAEGRRSQALRQYQNCQRVLDEELGVQPLPETANLVLTLLSSKRSPKNESNTEER